MNFSRFKARKQKNTTDNVKGTTYNHNYDYFDSIDTEQKAYLLGFVIADGCIAEAKSKRLCFGNSIDDISILELIVREISPESIIYRTNQKGGVKNRKEQVRVRISSNKLCSVLEDKYGIKPHKTTIPNFSFDFSLIDGSLWHHFIRGYFDGDGSVGFHKKEGKQISFDFSFVCSSVEFASQIASIIQYIGDVRPVIYEKEGKTCNFYLLRFDYSRRRGEKIEIIYEWLYKDATCFLERKRNKFISYFEYRANQMSKKTTGSVEHRR